MNLKELSLLDIKQYTSHYPLLLVGANNSGKSFALENMSDEDKARSAVLNFDIKPIGSGSDTEFYSVHAIASTTDALDKQIAILSSKGKKLLEEDASSPDLEKLKEQVKHLKQLKKQSYFIDDIEAIDKLVSDILGLTFNPDVDRVIVDTFTALVDFCEAWSNHHFSGREKWGMYGQALQKVQQAYKEATIFGYKYVYIMAHHEFIPAMQYATTPKKVVKVKGGIVSGNVEAGFNSVVFTHVTEEGKRMFECDVINSLDTSRTKIVDGNFSFERTSLDDLEKLFAKKKQVVSGALVEC